MSENTPNLGKDLNIQFHDIHKSPQNINTKCSSTRNIIFNVLNKRQTGHLKSSKRGKNFSHPRGPSEGYLHIFFNRNLSGKERLE